MSIAVRPLTGSDATGIARIRVEIADQGLLKGLGVGPVKGFMQLAAEDPDTFGAAAVEDERLVGFIVCTTASIRLLRRAMRSTPTLWLKVPLLALRDPAILRLGLRRLIALLRPPPSVTQSDEPPLRLFDLAVVSSARGRGVGRALLDAALAEARRRGHTEIGLTVLQDNAGAIRLYEAVGFRPNRTGTRDDGRTYLTMRLALKEPAPAPG